MKQKPNWIFLIASLLLAAFLNEWSIAFLIRVAGIQIPENSAFAFGQGFLAGDILSIYFLINAVLFFRGNRLRELLKNVGAYWFLLFLTLFLLIQVTNPVLAGRFTMLRLLAYGLSLFLLGKAFQLGVIKNKSNGERRKNLLALAGMIGVLWILLDMAFLFVPGTHNTIESLASRIWFQRHWQVNSLGYRDPEWDFAGMKGKRKILLVGDSFTAGHGLKNTSDRFGDRLQAKWGDQYAILNLGTLGYGPELELENLEMFPEKADAALIVWYVNDIHDAALRHGFDLDGFLGRENYRPRTLNPVLTSYFVNYLYWSFPHPKTENNYTDFLKAAFADEATRKDHLQQMDNLVQFCRSHDMKVAALLFPMMSDVEGSDFAIEPVMKHFHATGIPSLDISPLVKGKTPKELMVSKNDAHPNEWVNQVVADTLDQFLRNAWNLPQ